MIFALVLYGSNSQQIGAVTIRYVSHGRHLTKDFSRSSKCLCVEKTFYLTMTDGGAMKSQSPGSYKRTLIYSYTVRVNAIDQNLFMPSWTSSFWVSQKDPSNALCNSTSMQCLFPGIFHFVSQILHLQQLGLNSTHC